MDAIVIGGARLDIVDDRIDVSGESFHGASTGKAWGASVTTVDGGYLEVGNVAWADGGRDVRTFSRLSGPVIYDRLIHGGRLGIARLPDGRWTCELGIMSFHEDRQPTVLQAKQDDLERVLGSDPALLLESLGASGFGSRAEVYGDAGNRRNYLAVAFRDVDGPVPLGAYVLTRVLPLMTGFGRSGPVPVGQAT